jgi:GT2 family glycosyltransferase
VPETTSAPLQPKASVIICIHDALAEVVECLDALRRNTALPFELILVDDGSDAATKAHLASFAETHAVRLVTHEASRGYTVSANQGLRLASGELLVLLNSDTLPTAGWLEALIECSTATPRTGIVGPLSNSACWQTVPSMRGWLTNTLPRGVTLEQMAAIVRNASRREFPQATIVNGFCLGIRRQVIEAIGYLDEASFPVGYGEESDYCIRAAQAGFELRIADHCYVYHKKSRSFSLARREPLVKAGDRKLVEKFGSEYRKYTDAMDGHSSLPRIRRRVRRQLLLRRVSLLLHGKRA